MSDERFELTDEHRAQLLVSVTTEDAIFIRRVVRERDEAREALKRAKGLVEKWREVRWTDGIGAGLKVASDELEAALADPKPLMSGKHPKEVGRDTVALADQQQEGS